jgi:hypothetical protein
MRTLSLPSLSKKSISSLQKSDKNFVRFLSSLTFSKYRFFLYRKRKKNIQFFANNIQKTFDNSIVTPHILHIMYFYIELAR